VSARFFRARNPKERLCIAGCFIAIVVIWFTIFAQLSTHDPSGEEIYPDGSYATPESLPLDSAAAMSPLFDHEWAPDRAYSDDPFWPLASLQHSSPTVTLDSSPAPNALSNITFYGTLQRNQQLRGLIRDGNGRSRLVSVGDSVCEGSVETITEHGITVRTGGATCLLERQP
jgi:hypothetical protein